MVESNAAESSDHTRSVFLRISESENGSRDQVATTLLEIDREGYIPREVGLAEDGRPVYVTRPGEYGRWNDSLGARTPPGTPAFDEQWGRLGSEIGNGDFEAIFAEADAALPHTIGGTPLWVDRVVSWTIILVLLAIVVAVLYSVTRLFGS